MDIVLETFIVSISLLIFLFTANIFIKRYLYKYDSKKQKSTLNSFNIIIFFTIIFLIVEEYSHGNIAIMSKVFIIILFMKVVYHSLGYYFIKKFGKKLCIEESIKSSKLEDEILNKYINKIQISLDDKTIDMNNVKEKLKQSKLKLELDDTYILKNAIIYKKLEKYVSNKTTALIDIGLIILISIFAFAIIMPIIKPLNDIFNNDYMFAVLAFLGAYVLNPAFPDMYAFFTFVRNKNIDLEKFISFNDNGQIIKGRIIEMTTSHIILKDHVSGLSLTIPNMNLHNKVIKNLDDMNEYLGYKQVLEYVVDAQSYNTDNGIKLKSSFNNILHKFCENTKSITKQDKYNIWLSSHDFGIKITLWYFIKDIEQEEKIKLDIEDFILYETTKIGFDLRTPKLIQLV